MKTKKIKVKDDNTEHIAVRRESHSVSMISDNMRCLSDEEFKTLRKIAELYRKADKAADKSVNLDDFILRLREFDDREFRRAFAVCKYQRKADKMVAIAKKYDEIKSEQRYSDAALGL